MYLFLAALGLRCCAWAFSSCGEQGLRFVAVGGFSLRWLLLLQSTGSRRTGFSSRGTRAQQLWLLGSRAQAQQLWRMGLVALWHVGSSRTRARTHVPYIGRRILNHCATREVPLNYFCFFVKNQLGVFLWVYFQTFYFVHIDLCVYPSSSTMVSLLLQLYSKY